MTSMGSSKILGISLLASAVVYLTYRFDYVPATKARHLAPRVWEHPDYNYHNISAAKINETSYTVLMLTHNRTDIMLKNLAHFMSMKHTHKVILLWNNIGLEPPNDKLVALEKEHGKSVVVKIFTENKIRLRFQPYPEMDTSAIFSVDDDLLIAENDMDKTFDKWKSKPYTIVGFSSRGYTGSGLTGFQYDYKTTLSSLILTNSAFIHRGYLNMFMDTLPTEISQMIDAWQNCEDIAMNFIVSNYCRCQGAVPVTATGKYVHYGNSGGIWTKPGHKKQRDTCVDLMAMQFPALPQRIA